MQTTPTTSHLRDQHINANHHQDRNRHSEISQHPPDAPAQELAVAEEPEVLGDGERAEHEQKREERCVGLVLRVGQGRVFQGHVPPAVGAGRGELKEGAQLNTFS